jgi:hypothetical protein
MTNSDYFKCLYPNSCEAWDLTDNLIMVQWSDQVNWGSTYIKHFCNEGRSRGNIGKGYSCTNCGYMLNDKERFLIKMLNFNRKILLYPK